MSEVEVRNVVDSAEELYPDDADADATRLPFHHWSELDNLPKREFIVEGLIDRGGYSLLFGPSSVGKSLAMLDLGLSLARGADWHGRQVRQGAVLYIAAEGGLQIEHTVLKVQKSRSSNHRFGGTRHCHLDVSHGPLDCPRILVRSKQLDQSLPILAVA